MSFAGAATYALAVEIVIKGFVSTQEVEDTAKKLEAFIARHGKVNVLEIIEDFEGTDATWQDFNSVWFISTIWGWPRTNFPLSVRALAAITATARLPDHSQARLFRFWHQATIQSPARREVSY